MRTLLVLLLFCLGVQAATVTVQWDPNPESLLGGYKVYHGGETRIYTNVTDAGLNTTLQLTNLLLSSRYYIAATAYSTNFVESDFSYELLVYTPVPSPTNFRPTGVSAKSVTLTWTPPASNIFYYQIVYGSNAGIYPGLIQFTNTPPPYTVSNLVSGTTHFFRIAAFNDYGQASFLSSVITANTLLGKPTGLRFLTNSIQGSINGLGGPWTVQVARTVYELPTNFSSLEVRSFLEIGQEREEP